MMKKSIAILTLLLALVFSFVSPVRAAGQEFVFDQTGDYLSSSELASLNEKATQIYQQAGTAVIIYIIYNTDNADLSSFAQSKLQSGNYGSSEMVLALDMTNYSYSLYSQGAMSTTEAEQYLSGISADALYTGLDSYLTKIAAYYGVSGNTDNADTTDQIDLVYDAADILTPAEEQSLSSRLETISNSQRCQVSVVIVNGLGGKSITAFTDDFYDANGYGYGTNKDGVMLLLDMDSRDMHITTTGYGAVAFTDYGIEKAFDDFRSYLSDGAYAKAFDRFADISDRYLTLARNGTPYDVENSPAEPIGKVTGGLISLGIGALIGLIAILIMQAGMKSAKKQYAAQNYVRAGSFNLTENFDMYLYTHTTVTPRPKNTGGSGGGGSSMHMGSSGVSHGGGSSHF